MARKGGPETSGRSTCAWARGLMPFLASDTLPEAQKRALILHLENCERCRADLSEVLALRKDLNWRMQALPIERATKADLRSFVFGVLMPDLVEAFAPPVISRLVGVVMEAGIKAERRLEHAAR